MSAGTSKKCSTTQVAIDKRQHGAALNADERRLLEEHLASCMDCLAYREALEKLESAMQANTTSIQRNVDWNSLQQRASEHFKRHRSSMIRGVALTIGLVGLALTGYFMTKLPMFLEGGIWIGVIAAVFLSGDLLNARLMHKWAAAPVGASERRSLGREVVMLSVFVAGLLFVPVPSLEPAWLTEAITYLLAGGFLLGILHQGFRIKLLWQDRQVSVD